VGAEIARCPAVLVVDSARSEQSSAVRRELELAASARRTIVRLRYGDWPDMDLMLRLKQLSAADAAQVSRA